MQKIRQSQILFTNSITCNSILSSQIIKSKEEREEKNLMDFCFHVQYLSHCLWAPYLSLGATFLFYFSITEPSERRRRKRRKRIKKKKKKPRSKGRRRSHLVEKEKEKKEDEETHAPNQMKKKKKMVKSCG